MMLNSSRVNPYNKNNIQIRFFTQFFQIINVPKRYALDKSFSFRTPELSESQRASQWWIPNVKLCHTGESTVEQMFLVGNFVFSFKYV